MPNAVVEGVDVGVKYFFNGAVGGVWDGGSNEPGGGFGVFNGGDDVDVFESVFVVSKKVGCVVEVLEIIPDCDRVEGFVRRCFCV